MLVQSIQNFNFLITAPTSIANLQTVSFAQSLWVVTPQIVTIFVTTLIICVFSFIYYRKVKKMSVDEDPRGIVLVIELIIRYIEKIVVDILGIKYKNLTIYLMYLMLYILVGNWLSIIGLDSPFSMLTVTLSLGLVTFIGIYYVGIKFQKLIFFKKFLINPLELFTQFAPLISLSFRLFGNVTGGTIILLLLYTLTGNIWAKIPIIGQVNLLIGLFGWVFHSYFDLFAGSIQALIFGTLTMVYWQLQMETEATSEKHVKATLAKRLRRKQKPNIIEDNSFNDGLSNREILDKTLTK